MHFRLNPTRGMFAAATLVIGSMAPVASASVTLFGQTFYSTNTGLADVGGNVAWTTTASANSEMHTHFTPVTLAVGQTLNVAFGINLNEPQGDGGTNDGLDGIRMGLMDLTTLTNADGAHAATTGEGYRFRFNYEATGANGGIAHERTFGGNNANYLTSSGGIWDANPLTFAGFGLNADGTTTYPATFTVARTSATDAVATLTLNGVSRSYTDTGDGAFSFDTFGLSKISDQAPFQESAVFTLSNFSVSVVPEPATGALLGASLLSVVARRRRGR